MAFTLQRDKSAAHAEGANLQRLSEVRVWHRIKRCTILGQTDVGPKYPLTMWALLQYLQKAILNFMLVVVMCHFTKFVQLIPMRSKTAKATAAALLYNVFLVHGFPTKLTTDRGTEFISATGQYRGKIELFCEILMYVGYIWRLKRHSTTGTVPNYAASSLTDTEGTRRNHPHGFPAAPRPSASGATRKLKLAFTLDCPVLEVHRALQHPRSVHIARYRAEPILALRGLSRPRQRS